MSFIYACGTAPHRSFHQTNRRPLDYSAPRDWSLIRLLKWKPKVRAFENQYHGAHLKLFRDVSLLENLVVS